MTLRCVSCSGVAQDVPGPAPSVSVDFGDFQSGTLNGKAGEALANGKYDVALAYADKCIEIYGDQASQQQKALTAIPVGQDQTFAQWALNDVGMAYLDKGKALEGQNKAKEALAVYKTIVEKFAFAQVWDPQGWFWKPADVAAERITALTKLN